MGRLHYTDPKLAVPKAVEQAGEVAEAHTRVDRSRVEMMRGYAETTGCRRQFLLGYFGESVPKPCGHCDTCTDGTAVVAPVEVKRFGRRSKAPSDPYPLNAAVKHREWGDGVVMRLEPDRITVLFEQVGYRTLALAALQADEGLLKV